MREILFRGKRTMTDKEIIKALECCYRKGGTPCRDCPFNEFEDCNDVLMADYVFDLINRQQAEIERLKGWENLLKAESHAPIKTKARAEAIKEFAERLKKQKYQSSDWSHGEHPYVVEESDIDDVLDEMIGEGE